MYLARAESDGRTARLILAQKVARSFLVTEAAMAQRLDRAKRTIKAAHIRYRVPEDNGLIDRLSPLLAVSSRRTHPVG